MLIVCGAHAANYWDYTEYLELLGQKLCIPPSHLNLPLAVEVANPTNRM